MKNVFNIEDSERYIERLNLLKADTTPNWGKMNAPQMLAHLNVMYELVYEEDKHPKPKGLMKFLLRAVVKKMILSPKKYKQNLQTAPFFKIADPRDFEKEKSRLMAHIRKTQQLGAPYFDGKISSSFGKLRDDQWNTMMTKHLEHHFEQFGI